MAVDDAPDVDPRPRSLHPAELGFTPQSPVGWLQPVQLAGTALRVILSQLFGAYLDKRELQNALPSKTYDEATGRDELWFDFVADLGDGFDSTYSVAYLLAQPGLAVDGQQLPRGQVLLMGGDEVYPTASTQAYEDRTKGPYKAALPCVVGQPSPQLYALPGNHDWYDGLTAFLRLFVKDGADSIGAWVNAQARSYFAIQLPHRWWLMAIDIQSSVYIDDPQLRYFHEVATRLGPDDRVIVCTPTPGWVEAVGDHGAYDTIDYFMRSVLEPTGARVKLMLSGDLHHYAHYQGDDRELVHCGGGGAYLYPTHELPEQIQVPPPASLSRKQSNVKPYRLAATFPTKATSRRLAAGVFGRLPLRNPTFILLVGLLHMLFALSIVEQLRHTTGTVGALVSIPVTITGLLLLGAGAGFAMLPKGVRELPNWVAGLSHGVVHIGLGVVGGWLWSLLPFVDWPWPLSLIAALVLYLPVFGLIATEVVCVYLLLASKAHVNLNELFAGQAIIDEKSFLRLHLGKDGTLTVYPVAVPRVCRKWTPTPGAPADRPWFEPDAPIGLTLIEPPITIR
jgi:hypothetical protein